MSELNFLKECLELGSSMISIEDYEKAINILNKIQESRSFVESTAESIFVEAANEIAPKYEGKLATTELIADQIAETALYCAKKGIESQLQAKDWVSVEIAEAELEDRLDYLVSDGRSVVVARYWKAINKWISCDASLGHNAEIKFVIPSPITPPTK